jgi:Haem-binding domain
MKWKILISLAILLVVIQFIRTPRNESNDNSKHISTAYPIPTEVNAILKVACDDCHTNKTKYPWYADVQPVAYWLSRHVRFGKEKLNFSEFTNLRLAVQNHKFEEIIEFTEEKKMPISSYTWLGLHPEAKLTDGQRKVITDWARTQMDSLAVRYPADSLVLKRKK